MNPLTAIDFYKADHRNQYPKGTTEVQEKMGELKIVFCDGKLYRETSLLAIRKCLLI